MEDEIWLGIRRFRMLIVGFIIRRARGRCRGGRWHDRMWWILLLVRDLLPRNQEISYTDRNIENWTNNVACRGCVNVHVSSDSHLKDRIIRLIISLRSKWDRQFKMGVFHSRRLWLWCSHSNVASSARIKGQQVRRERVQIRRRRTVRNMESGRRRAMNVRRILIVRKSWATRLRLWGNCRSCRVTGGVIVQYICNYSKKVYSIQLESIFVSGILFNYSPKQTVNCRILCWSPGATMAELDG